MPGWPRGAAAGGRPSLGSEDHEQGLRGGLPASGWSHWTPPLCADADKGKGYNQGARAGRAGSPGEVGRGGVTALSREQAAQAVGGDSLGNRAVVGTGVALGELRVLEASGWMPGCQVWT